VVPLIAGIVCWLVAWLVLLPYPIEVILWIAGAVLVIYGVWVLLVGTRGPVPPRGRRYWY
jgi:hypothetical protein